MLENLKRQEAVSPTIDRALTLEMLLQLQTLYFGDDDAVLKYGDPSYWEDLSGNALTCRRNVDGDPTKDDEENNKAAMHGDMLQQISSRGYHVLPPPPGRINKSNTQIFSNTLDALALAGWPPQFLLMYDETWELLQDTVRAMFGQACDNYYIESDVNIWSLKRNNPPGTYYIGGNFIHPHRDMMYDACHNDDEEPTSLSVWIPLNPSGATRHNGCMRIIPIDEDDFFYSPLHPNHSKNSKYTDDDAEKLLCEQFGCGVWDPACVHWGGSFDAEKSEEEPRSSLAFTIRLGEKSADYGTSCIASSKDQTGPGACLVKDCHKGGPKRRLQVVAKSLLAYSHHWPGFPFEGFRKNMGLKE